MKIIYILSFLLLSSCVSHRGTLFLKDLPQSNKIETVDVLYSGILSSSDFNEAIRNLKKQYSKPIQLIGNHGGSIYSFEEFIKKTNGEMPTVLDYFIMTNGNIVVGMDYKDVWLSKNQPPEAIFIFDEFVVWRYKDDSTVLFSESGLVIRDE